MSRRGLRRFLRLPDDTLPILLGAVAGAAWFLLFFTDVAYADDCIAYIKKVKNFIAIPKGLLEDCMRTGVIQAIMTAGLGGTGGIVTVIAVNEILKNPNRPGPHVRDPLGPPNREYGDKDNPWDPPDDARKDRWKKDGLVWDPDTLSWRPPRPGEYPPPEDPPEEPPPYEKQNPREETPPQCLELYDDYVKAQGTLQKFEPDLEKKANELKLAQDWLQLKLTLFTVQFGMDLTDFMTLGVAGIKMGGPISGAIGKMGSVGELLAAAGRKAASLARAVGEAASELAQLGARAARMRSLADVAGDTAQHLARKVDEIADGMLALDKRVANNRSLLSIAQEVDSLAEQRQALMPRLVDAEKKLRAAEGLWQRRRELQTWAEGQRASIVAEQARLAQQARAELEAIRAEIQNLRAKIAQSPEVTEAGKRLSRATTAKHALEADIRELEAAAQLKVKQIETVRTLHAKKQAFLEAETARDSLIDAVNAADAEVLSLKAQAKQLAEGPELESLRAQRSATTAEWEEANARYLENAGYARQADADYARITNEIDEALIARQGQPPMTPEELGRLNQARKELSNLQDEAARAKTARDMATGRLDEIDKAIEAEQAAAVARAKELDLENKIGMAESKGDALKERRPKVEAEYDRASAELQRYSHPGVDPDALPDLEHQLDTMRAQMREKRAQLPDADREFDEAYNIDQNVRTQLEGTQREALEARQAEAEGRVRQAERGWQEVAADRDPGKFQQWKVEVEGTDPFNDGPKDLEALQHEVLDLRKQETEIEGKINAHRDKLGNETSGSLQQKLADDEAALRQARDEHPNARQKAEEAKAEAEKADGDARAAELEREAKEREVANLQAQQGEADAEVARLQAGGDGGLDPDFPRGPDAIDNLTQRSHELSEQYKPVVVKQFEEGVKSVAAQFGKKWEQLFNGQSPDEVAQGIKKSRDKVIRLKEELETMMTACDTARDDMKRLKPLLDACLEQHRYWRES